MIDYDKVRLSLMRLEEQFENYQRPNPVRSRLDSEGIAESVIQRFETCYDCLWKVLKRYIIEELGFANPPNSPKPIFRLAFENDLLVRPVSQWFLYANAIAGTSRDYDLSKADQCLALVPAFIEDAVGLYETMTESIWRQ